MVTISDLPVSKADGFQHNTLGGIWLADGKLEVQRSGPRNPHPSGIHSAGNFEEGLHPEL